MEIKMKLILLLPALTSLQFTSAKIFPGRCPFSRLINTSECLNDEFFKSQNTSIPFNSYQVIARMEFEFAKGISMFYTYHKQNLVAIIERKFNSFSIACLPPTEPKQNHLNFGLKFVSADLCNIMESIYVILPNNLNFVLFKNSQRPEIFVTRKNEYLAFWGCVQKNDLIYDLAAWILFSDNSIVVSETQDLKDYIKKFLESLSEVNLNFSEKDFNLNKLEPKKWCENNTKFIYEEVRKDVEEMKNKVENLNMKSSEYKLTFTITIFLVFFGVIVLFFVVSKILSNQCRVSFFWST